MPGFTNSDNLFGISDFIVGGSLGDGCNYTSIQAAVTDAIAAGNQSVYIRPGNYFENVTIGGTVALIGCSGPSRNSSVIIDGSIVCTDGSISLVNLKVFPTAPAIKPLTINTGAFVQLFCENVDLDSMTTIDTAVHFVAGSADIEFIDCLIRSGANAAILDDIGASLVIRGSTITCSGATACYIANGIGYQLTAESCLFESTGGEIHVSNNIGGFIARYCRFNNGTAATEAFKLNNAVSILNIVQCDVLCAAVSTNWVNGIGALNYGGVVLQSTAINIAGTLASITPYDWKPYAEDGVAPGTGVIRGTASFDSAQFSVVDGFVQALPAGIFPWVDQPISTTVVSNQGNFVTGALVTLTLPAAPAQGDTCAFKDPIGTSPFIVQANVGQFLQVGGITSVLAGSATSSLIGDSLELTYHAASSTWVCNAVVGNWIIV